MLKSGRKVRKVGRRNPNIVNTAKVGNVSTVKQGKGKRWDAIEKRIPKEVPVTGAEVGVLNGNTAHRILAARPNLYHIMIDPWRPPAKDSSYYASGDDNSRNSKEKFEACYQKTKALTAFAGDRAVIMRMKSKTAAGKIEDESLDFVFIDGDHSYEGVSEDISLWLPKLKSSGWIGGHDYDHPRLPGVKKAVDEAFPSEVIELDVNRTWFVRIDKIREAKSEDLSKLQ